VPLVLGLLLVMLVAAEGSLQTEAELSPLTDVWL
jgi:hypothetical protein